MNLDMTDSMGLGILVRHMQNPSYTYDEYLICSGLGPSISSVICKNLSYSGPSYPSSPVFTQVLISQIGTNQEQAPTKLIDRVASSEASTTYGYGSRTLTSGDDINSNCH